MSAIDLRAWIGRKESREDVVAEFVEAGWALARESDALPYQYFLMFKPPSP